MTRKKRADSWRERRRRASIRYQRAVEAERIRIDKRLKRRGHAEMEDFVGKVVVLVFFDTYCPPCISELSYLKRLHKRAGDEIVILSVDVDPIHDTVEVLRRFREENGISWPILIGTSKVIDAYKIQYTPTTLLIDRDGFIYKGYIGWDARASPSRLDDDINYLLGGEG